MNHIDHTRKYPLIPSIISLRGIIIGIFLLTFANSGKAQHSFSAIIKDQENGSPIPGVTAQVTGTEIGSVSDNTGRLFVTGIPGGKQVLIFRMITYQTRVDTFFFPLKDTLPVVIFLESEEEELEEVEITATRSSRTIKDLPTRVEFIAGEELEEKGNMKPGDIRMMLNESTGIQTQQTSATSYNSSIRIQGLDGKYTQILRDGFPLYSGYAGGLSLLQIVPLDLRQVEVIKGASSTLYGGGAIAGLVNLVSKTPGEKREMRFLFNGTSAMGLDGSGFYSQRFKKTGTTVFASLNTGKAYDPAGIGLTAIPEFRRVTVNPKLFFYPGKNLTIYTGLNYTGETRTGGDMKYIEGKGDSTHAYFEKNSTERWSTQSALTWKANERVTVNAKNSLGYFNRRIRVPDYEFSGIQRTSYSELNGTGKTETSEWIGGLNLWTEAFTQNKPDTGTKTDYSHVTTGMFLQNTWKPVTNFSLETGFRADHQNEYGWFFLPRVSALLQWSEDLSFRLGGGMGYKTPTIFTEEAERVHFREIDPILSANTRAERSTGGNLDVNYRVQLPLDIGMTLNVLAFYTRVDDPLQLVRFSMGNYQYIQPDGFIDTKGIESNLRLTRGNYKLFVGYTLADVYQTAYGTKTPFTLVARHRLNNVLMYEVEDEVKVGLEAYYYSRQRLSDGATGKPYWICGLMVEKMYEWYSVFVNFENFTNTRQTRFDTIYTGTVTNPQFRDIYAPVDGFVVNGGLKIRL